MTTTDSPALPHAAETASDLPARVAARRLSGHTAGLFGADGEGFVTRPIAELELDLEGILLPGLAGDRHRGHSRAADARVPWYPRGTRIRNARQVSILSPDELAEIARALEVSEVTPEEIGANLLVEGIPHLSHLPRGTRLHFPSGASLAVEDENAPCRFAGASVAKRNPGRTGLDLAFVTAARHRRGLVAWVERPGRIQAGDPIDVRIPEQWIY
jgi:hypothetical protein